MIVTIVHAKACIIILATYTSGLYRASWTCQTTKMGIPPLTIAANDRHQLVHATVRPDKPVNAHCAAV